MGIGLVLDFLLHMEMKLRSEFSETVLPQAG